MTCKDCIHYDVCEGWQVDERRETLANGCADFKDKSKYIELPCKGGDKAYFIWNFDEPEIQECEVKEFKLKISGAYIVLDYVDCIGHHDKAQVLINHINKTVFLTKSEAEQKVKELKENV